MEPIRVLHYIKHLETGGGERLIFNIYQHIDKSEVQFDFAVNTAEEEKLDARIREMGGRIYPICNREPRFIPLKLRVTAKGFKRLLQVKHYDIVHIHCSNGQGLYYSQIAKQCGVNNIICHIHNTSVVGRFEKIKNIVHNHFRHKYMDAPTEYFACSMDAAKWLYDDRVINGEHHQILKNGIDVNRFKFSERDREDIRKQLGLANEKVLCTVGRCVKEKNQIYILQVLERLLKQEESYRLILIGQGELEGELKEYAFSHGMRDKVIFIKSSETVEKYMSASDCFLLASSASEGLGIVTIEAQANGLQTIVSDNVPDDVLISPFCNKIHLSDGVEIWAERVRELIEKNQKDDRLSAGQFVKDAGYEIQSVSDGVQQFYKSLLII